MQNTPKKPKTENYFADFAASNNDENAVDRPFASIIKREQHGIVAKAYGKTERDAEQMAVKITSQLNAFDGLNITPKLLVEGNAQLEKDYEALKTKNEMALDLLDKTRHAIDIAILSTPSGHARNTLTDINIRIANLLNPDLAKLP